MRRKYKGKPYFRRNIISGAAAGIMALLMSCSVPMAAMAGSDTKPNWFVEDEDAPPTEDDLYNPMTGKEGQEAGQSYETNIRPEEPDNKIENEDVIEYSQIKQWLREYNPVIKSANETYYILEVEAMEIVSQLREEARDLYDEAEDLEDLGTAEAKEAAKYLKKNVRALRKYANKQEQAAANMDGNYNRRALNHTEDTLVCNVQMLMNTYWQLQSQKAALEKNVEAAEAASAASQAMAAQGMVVESGLLASSTNLGSAKASLTALNASLEKVKRNIYTLTGQGYASGKEIGQVPTSDLSRLDGIDLDKDCEAAVGNNYDLITQRHTDLDVKTNKTSSSRLRQIEEAEDQMRVTIRGLYQDMMGKKASYEAAQAAYESAQITWRGAQVQQQQGMLNRAEFLQKEAAFLNAEYAYKKADLELFQAMETYDWAIKGLLVSDDSQ